MPTSVVFARLCFSVDNFSQVLACTVVPGLGTLSSWLVTRGCPQGRDVSMHGPLFERVGVRVRVREREKTRVST